MREWGAEAVTFLVKAALYYKPANGMKDNKVSFKFFMFDELMFIFFLLQ